MDDLHKQINDLTQTVERLQSLIPKDLIVRMDEIRRFQNEVPTLAAPPSASTVTSAGNIPVIISGKRYNLMTGT